MNLLNASSCELRILTSSVGSGVSCPASKSTGEDTESHPPPHQPGGSPPILQLSEGLGI